MKTGAGLSKAEAQRQREELIPQVIALREAGTSWPAISATLGVSSSALRRWAGPAVIQAPKPKPPSAAELAARAVEMAEQGLSAWTISRELGTSHRDVERAIAAAKLREQVASGRLRIRQATPAEMEEFRRQRERHDRQQIRDRERALGVA